MKKITLIAAFLLFSFASNAQRFREVVKWEVETRIGGLLFGISETKDGADVVMRDFQKRNADSKYDITSHPAKYKFTTVSVDDADENPVDNFKSHTSGKAYKVLSAEDIKSVDIAKRKGLDAGIEYYVGARGADRNFVKNRLNKLLNNFEEYRINSGGSRFLVSNTKSTNINYNTTNN